MFDAGLFEMLVIFTLGLLVLGPERLPRVARFVGRWVGQARRAVTRLNNEIERELALDEIRRIQRESEEAMRREEESIRRELTGEGGSVEDAESGAARSGDAGDGEDAADGEGAGEAQDDGAAPADVKRDVARH